MKRSHLGMHHLAVRVRNLDCLRRFSVDLLGFAVKPEVEHEEVCLTSGRDTVVSVRDDAHGASKPSLDHLGVVVASAAAVEAWHC